MSEATCVVLTGVFPVVMLTIVVERRTIDVRFRAFPGAWQLTLYSVVNAAIGLITALIGVQLGGLQGFWAFATWWTAISAVLVLTLHLSASVITAMVQREEVEALAEHTYRANHADGYPRGATTAYVAPPAYVPPPVYVPPPAYVPAPADIEPPPPPVDGAPPSPVPGEPSVPVTYAAVPAQPVDIVADATTLSTAAPPKRGDARSAHELEADRTREDRSAIPDSKRSD